MGFRAGIAHCNFGLRDDESEGDAEFVRKLAQDYNLNFYLKKFDVKFYAKKHSISIQMAARELRYKWFEEIRVANGYKWIATAHHANDSFETVLLNLTRGTGLSGLNGIAAKHNTLIRPMLYVTKAEVLAYAKNHNLEWREDRSNNTDEYKRNMIRHEAIPVFQRLNPALEATFKITSEKLSSANTLLNEFLQTWKATVLRIERDTIKLNIPSLLSSSEPGYRLWYVLEEYGFAYRQVAQIIESLSGIPGKTFFSPTHMLLVDRSEIILEARTNHEKGFEWIIETHDNPVNFENQPLSLEKLDAAPRFETLQDGEILVVNEEKLIFPLKIRGWQKGDRFCPLGMLGKSKKLSDLFTDLKLDLFQKQKIRLLVNGNGDIIWVIGIRPDERYKVDEQTKNFITFSIYSRSDLDKI
ncbi:tRNA(Ile)-lysidine synthase [Dyadobacter arcticus]|uniref:tRNA(Ile)-lysidine synthase n=2 Tax=Dyadobacter arcticus TaxID=1078754 RepID=A0ABX0UGR1_9BACT|nr:tRNA(Ile)-lysidine synthase [Dyadobacter arcticus]